MKGMRYFRRLGAALCTNIKFSVICGIVSLPNGMFSVSLVFFGRTEENWACVSI